MTDAERIDQLEQVVLALVKKEMSTPSPVVTPPKASPSVSQEALLSAISKVMSQKQQRIKERLDYLMKHKGLGPFRPADSQMSVGSQLDEVIQILREAFDDEDAGSGAESTLSILRDVLQSEQNPIEEKNKAIADSFVDNFMREVREHDFGRA